MTMGPHASLYALTEFRLDVSNSETKVLIIISACLALTQKADGVFGNGMAEADRSESLKNPILKAAYDTAVRLRPKSSKPAIGKGLPKS